MKRIVCILMVVALSFGLVACGESKPASVTEERDTTKVADSNEDEKKTEEETKQDDIKEKMKEMEETKRDDIEEEIKEMEEYISRDNYVENGEPNTTPNTTPDDTQTAPPTTNEFYNDNNNTYDVNCVSIKPRHVYWDNGTLVAECFVINGINRTVSNLNVESITLSNGSGVIASAAFGGLNGASIAPYTNIIWTFKFGPDTVYMQNADLSYLKCNADVTYYY